MTDHNCSEISREEMVKSFNKGLTLIQEEWSSPREIQDVDDLIAKGKAVVEDNWRYYDNYDCRRRRVRGIKPILGGTFHN